MTHKSAVHGTFNLKKTYSASRSEVFSAFADPERKRQWAHMAPKEAFQMTFEVGGTERVEMRGPGGGTFKYEGTFFEIVENERIIYSYSFDMGRGVSGVTLTTIELADADDGGTHLKFTEQGVYLDGFDGPKFWEAGTTSLLKRLGEHVDG